MKTIYHQQGSNLTDLSAMENEKVMARVSVSSSSHEVQGETVYPRGRQTAVKNGKERASVMLRE